MDTRRSGKAHPHARRRAVLGVVVAIGVLGVIGAAVALSSPIAVLRAVHPGSWQPQVAADAAPAWDSSSVKARAVAAAAMAQVGRTVRYDAAYVPLSYPGGDVPLDRGVCTDVVIRAFRSQGVDLQQLVHEDMSAHFAVYPRQWGLSRPDASIDHRRVPNLQTFFRRRGTALPVTTAAHDYLPGDVVTWTVTGRPHTGLVSSVLAPGAERFQIVHNIGAGTEVQDCMFSFPITGHYRWF